MEKHPERRMRWVIEPAGRWGKEFRAELRSANGDILFDFVRRSHDRLLDDIEELTGVSDVEIIDRT